MNVSYSQGTPSLPGEKNTKATVCNVTFIAQRKKGLIFLVVERRLCCESEALVGS